MQHGITGYELLRQFRKHGLSYHKDIKQFHADLAEQQQKHYYALSPALRANMI